MQWKNSIFTVVAGIADLLYPSRCPACGEMLNSPATGMVKAICPSCTISLVTCEPPMCPVCGLPFQGDGCSDHLCPDCEKSYPPFDAARSAFHYGGCVHQLVAAFKYRGKIHAGEVLCRIAMDGPAFLESAESCQAVVTVPMHTIRLLKRGFNHSAIVARMIAGEAHIPFYPEALLRIRNIPPQAGLRRKERLVNVKGAFALNKTDSIRGKRILLVDDV